MSSPPIWDQTETLRRKKKTEKKHAKPIIRSGFFMFAPASSWS